MLRIIYLSLPHPAALCPRMYWSQRQSRRTVLFANCTIPANRLSSFVHVCITLDYRSRSFSTYARTLEASRSVSTCRTTPVRALVRTYTRTTFITKIIVPFGFSRPSASFLQSSHPPMQHNMAKMHQTEATARSAAAAHPTDGR